MPPENERSFDRPVVFKEIDPENYLYDTKSEFRLLHHDRLPERLVRREPVGIEGKPFYRSYFPLEEINMGIAPMIQCPSCNRMFHTEGPAEITCPICGEEMIIADKIAQGTPAVDYNGEDTLPPTPQSIESKR